MGIFTPHQLEEVFFLEWYHIKHSYKLAAVILLILVSDSTFKVSIIFEVEGKVHNVCYLRHNSQCPGMHLFLRIDFY